MCKIHELLPPAGELGAFAADFRMSGPALDAIAGLLCELRPKVIIETGPGISSWCFFKYLSLFEGSDQATYLALNHPGAWDDRFRDWCHKHAFPTDKVLTVALNADEYYDLSQVKLPICDFLCLDGPVESGSRNSQAARELVQRVALPGRTTILLDDVNRCPEQQFSEWLQSIGFRHHRTIRDDRFTFRQTAIFGTVASRN